MAVRHRKLPMTGMPGRFEWHCSCGVSGSALDRADNNKLIEQHLNKMRRQQEAANSMRDAENKKLAAEQKARLAAGDPEAKKARGDTWKALAILTVLALLVVTFIVCIGVAIFRFFDETPAEECSRIGSLLLDVRETDPDGDYSNLQLYYDVQCR